MVGYGVNEMKRCAPVEDVHEATKAFIPLSLQQNVFCAPFLSLFFYYLLLLVSNRACLTRLA